MDVLRSGIQTWFHTPHQVLHREFQMTISGSPCPRRLQESTALAAKRNPCTAQCTWCSTCSKCSKLSGRKPCSHSRQQHMLSGPRLESCRNRLVLSSCTQASTRRIPLRKGPCTRRSGMAKLQRRLIQRSSPAGTGPVRRAASAWHIAGSEPGQILSHFNKIDNLHPFTANRIEVACPGTARIVRRGPRRWPVSGSRLGCVAEWNLSWLPRIIRAGSGTAEDSAWTVPARLGSSDSARVGKGYTGRDTSYQT